MAAPTLQVVLSDRPKSRLGTPTSTGPYSRLRLDTTTKLEQGLAVMDLVWGAHCSMRTAAQILGMSRMTAWRRFWFVIDWGNAGNPADTIPHQRSTRGCPNGRPTLLPRDAAEVCRQLIAAGAPAEVIADSRRAIPACVRHVAAHWAYLERLESEAAMDPEPGQRHHAL